MSASVQRRLQTLTGVQRAVKLRSPDASQPPAHDPIHRTTFARIYPGAARHNPRHLPAHARNRRQLSARTRAESKAETGGHPANPSKPGSGRAVIRPVLALADRIAARWVRKLNPERSH